MNDNKRLTAGEFAQLLHIDRHRLDKYDEIGLFQPNFRENNGHKWYVIDQVNDWQLLTGLLELGLTTHELQSRSKTPLLDLLAIQQTRIQGAIERLKRMQKRVSTNLAQLETTAGVAFDKVLETELKAMHLLETPVTQSVDSAVMTHLKCWQQFEAETELFSVGQRFSRVKTDDQPVALITAVQKAHHQPRVKKLVAGQCLVVYHRGAAPYETVFDSMETYARKQQLQLTDDYFVFPIQTQLEEPLTQTTLTKIIIPIRS